MGLARLVHRVGIVAALLSLLGTGAWAANTRLPNEKIKALADTPREITQAIRIRADLVQNQLQANLQGSSSGRVIVEVQIETFGGFHLYEDRLLFFTQAEELFGSQEWKVTLIDRPRTIRFLDPVSRTLKEGYSGQSLFRLELATPIASVGKIEPSYQIPLVVQFQACNDKVCLLPAAIKFPVALLNPEQRKSKWSDQAESLLRERLAQADLLVYLLLFFAGLITAFTPCVYPLYPLTLGLFSRWSAGRANQSFQLALAYCGGMTLTYAVLGLITAASGAVFGSLTQRPEYLITIGLLMAVSALAFSGWIPFPGANWLAERFGRADSNSKGSNSKAFGMGATLGLVASPCVGPMLVVVLAFLSQELNQSAGLQNYILGFLMLASFGLGMSTPFLVLGHWMLRLGRRPQWGRFTPVIKNLGTVLMLGSSLYFLVPGIQLLTRDPLGPGAAKLFTPTDAEKRDPTKLAIIDFRADWCAACLELEHKTFSTPEVASFINSGEFQFIQIDLTTEDSPWSGRLGVVSLPTVHVLNRDGSLCEGLSLFEFESSERFVERLNRARRECR
jgi:thiol:disulfide interchange protein